MSPSQLAFAGLILLFRDQARQQTPTTLHGEGTVTQEGEDTHP